MVRLSVGMREQVPTTGFDFASRSVQRYKPPDTSTTDRILMITNDDEDAEEFEYISLLTKTRIKNNMGTRAIEIRHNWRKMAIGNLRKILFETL